ncbi:helix-turn-helix transcriptional regulator [Paraburkholderia sediminicola]|uniref:helix-turn-helix transcriptional regulator n=1 Tax=Paraburkholderia TaxID=1822464 RepID=UPI0038B9844B
MSLKNEQGGPRNTVRLRGPAVKEARQKAGWTQETLAEIIEVDTATIGRIETEWKSRKFQMKIAEAIAFELKVSLNSIIDISSTGSLILLPDQSLSRIISGSMIQLDGDQMNNAPFAFRFAFRIKATAPGSLISINCLLYKERLDRVFPAGKDYEDYLDDWEALQALPQVTERDYAYNGMPGHIIGGGNGLFPAFSRVDTITMQEKVILFDNEPHRLGEDLKTFTAAYRLQAGRDIVVQYDRICRPGKTDEAPVDYIDRAQLDCTIVFFPEDAHQPESLSWDLAFGESGADLHLRTN